MAKPVIDQTVQPAFTEVEVTIDKATFARKDYAKGDKIKCTPAQALILKQHGITEDEVKHG